MFYMYRVIKKSGFFDKDFYLRNNLDVARSCANPIKHYLHHGWREGREPNQHFDSKWYLETYQDVRESGMNPLYHYIKYGLKEGRDALPYFLTDNYICKNPRSVLSNTTSMEDYIKSNKFGYNPKNIWQYSVSEAELLRRVREYNKQKKGRTAKVVVYTALIGNYDPLILPEYICDDWDYVCFSDSDIPGEHIFKICNPDYYNPDPVRMARYIKTHPHLYFRDYDYSIWNDSHLMIKGPHLANSLRDCINRNVLLMGNPHPHRNCVYDEVKKCISLCKDNKETMEKQVVQYKEEGFPKSYGLLETGILIRKHNDENIIRFNELWWDEINKGSRRDQLSIMYVLWKQKLPHELLPDMQDVRLSSNKDYYLFLHGQKANRETPAYKQPFFMRKVFSSQNQPIIKKTFSEKEIENLRDESIDIIICVHNALEDVEICLESVYKNLLPRHKLVLVDDGSDEDTMNFLKNFAQKDTRQIKTIRNSKARGYTKAANTGLKESSAPFVILLNSDTIVCKNWAVKLLQTAKSSPEIGVVGPLSNAASWQSIPLLRRTNSEDYCINQLPERINVEDMDRFCETSGYFKEFPKVPLVNGFCYGIKREVIDSIGYLDEELFPNGYGEEDDFSLRALNAGFCCAIATHCYIYHSKSKSFGKIFRNRMVNIRGKVLTSRYGETCIKNAVKFMLRNPELNDIRESAKDFYNKPAISNVSGIPQIAGNKNELSKPRPFEQGDEEKVDAYPNGIVLSKGQVSDAKTLKSLLLQNNISFFEFGCSKGEGLLWVNQKISKKGVGFDIDPKKIEETLKKGFICTDYNILDLKDEKLVRFSTFFHTLEHLESFSQAESFIVKACQVSYDNVYIRQPFFDSEPYLFYNGLKTYYSHWSGHKNLMTTPVFYYILEYLRNSKMIKDYVIAFKEPVKSSQSNIILPITAPVNSLFYDSKIHPAKPNKIIFTYPVYKEILVCLDITGEGYGELWPKFEPSKIVFDSRHKRNINNTISG